MAIRLTPGSVPTATEGAVYYDSTSDSVKVYNGTVWKYLSNEEGVHKGGAESDYTSGTTRYRVHTFKSSGTFTPVSAVSVDYLIVGGGGQGANGGGGAGGVLTAASYSLTVQDYTIVIGGNNTGSSFTPASGSALAAHRGGMNSFNTPHGSGAGGGDNASGFSGTAGQGNTGGSSATSAYGGGGGAGGNGVNYAGGVGGAGGIGTRVIMGLTNNTAGWVSSTALLASAHAGVVDPISGYRYIAGGGGGADSSAPGGVGGLGGGGTALDAAGAGATGYPQAGQINTGSGGGGGYNVGAGYGGSGIVIIRYVI